MKNNLRILAVSGSLRANSYNTQILHGLKNLFPADTNYFIYEGIATLPHFDGVEDAPPSVKQWRQHIEQADAVLICSPEYAFGVPGSLKNALDWTVGSGEFTYKPVAIVTASSSGEKAHAALLNIFTALSANIIDEGTLLVSYVRTKVNDKGEITDNDTLLKLKTVVNSIIQEANKPARKMV